MRFGGIVALDGLSFAIEEGQICGLIGPNGAGKTTLFNVVSRIYQPTPGASTSTATTCSHVPAHGIAQLGIARTFQNLALFPSMTLLENVMVGAHSRGTVGFVRAIAAARRPWGGARRPREFAYELLDAARPGRLAFRPAAGLPFGTLKRLELARALAAQPEFLLLDEPAVGPDPRRGRRARRHRSSEIRDAVRPHRAARRAPHGAGDGHLRPGRGHGLRPQDRRGHARRGAAATRRSSRPTWGPPA